MKQKSEQLTDPIIKRFKVLFFKKNPYNGGQKKMKLHSNCLSGPKIEAFLKVYPILKESFGDESFHVDDAIRIVNSHDELEVRAYKGSVMDQRAKAFCDKTGHVSLNMQNACHCFAGRHKSSVVDKSTSQKHQLLDVVAQMTYRVRKASE